MAVTSTPLASFAQAAGFGAGAASFAAIVDPTQQAAIMLQASRAIESRCQRRLAPFTAFTETHRAEGVDPEILGQADMPLDLQSALGYSQQLAFASTSMVRDLWLDQYAPAWPDLWTYTLDTVELVLAFGDTLTVQAGEVEGPEPDTGHLRFKLGVFCPVGTTVRVTYDAGYTVAIPDDLQLACILQAVKFAIIGSEPEQRDKVSTVELDAEILSLLAPYMR